MMKKFVSKIKALKKHKQTQIEISGQSLREKCQNITSQFSIFKDSLYFTTHLPLILSSESIESLLDTKVEKISTGITENSTYQIQLASIILNISQEDGLFYLFIKLWVSFCEFELKKILKVQQNYNNTSNLKQKSEGQSSMKSNQNHEENQWMAPNNQKICSFFHKQFFLLCYFIHQLSLFLYKRSFSSCEGFSTHQLFQVIRNNITSVRQWSVVHQIFRRHVKCLHQNFSQKQIQDNMSELEKICKISKIPAPFLESINLMSQFNKNPCVEDKLRNAVQLIQKLKKEMSEYRILNGMDKQHVFCADDVLSALTFAMWRHRKNIYGSCVYVEIILCCEFEKVDEERLAQELNNFGWQTRYSFDTVRSVARIGLLEQDKIYSII